MTLWGWIGVGYAALSWMAAGFFEASDANLLFAPVIFPIMILGAIGETIRKGFTK
jgi:uncharacterized membrane protein